MSKVFFTVTTLNHLEIGIDSVACWDRVFSTEEEAIASVIVEMKEMLESPYGFEGREEDDPIRFNVKSRKDGSIVLTCDGLDYYLFIIQPAIGE
jgi:hypothetical protein